MDRNLLFVQECSMVLRVPQYHNDLVRLAATGVNYRGPPQLTQFTVMKVLQTNYTDRVQFTMQFRRR